MSACEGEARGARGGEERERERLRTLGVGPRERGWTKGGDAWGGIGQGEGGEKET